VSEPDRPEAQGSPWPEAASSLPREAGEGRGGGEPPPPPQPSVDPPPAPPPPTAAEPAAPDPVVESLSTRWVAQLRARGKHPELAAFLAFLIPGLGHVYLGKVLQGAISFLFLVGLFAGGVLLSKGECVSLDKTNGHPYAFFAQVGAGLPCGLALLYSHTYEVKKALGMEAERPAEPNVESDEYVKNLPKMDEGLLYTMIAGLLNLLLIHDALMGSPGSALRAEDEKRRAQARARAASAVAAPVAASPSPANAATNGQSA